MNQGWVSAFEFWQMHPDEVWWLLAAKTPPNDDDKWADLYRMLD